MTTRTRRTEEMKAATVALAGLDEEEARIASLLDRDAAFRAVASTIPRLTGLDTALVGEFKGDDHGRVVLRLVRGERPHGAGGRRWAHPLDGLVVPAGLGLGGTVLATRAPQGVRDYCRATSITHDFDTQVRAAGLRGMIAVPVIQGPALIGILYGASPHRAHFAGRRLATMVDAAQRAANAALVAERARHAAEVAVHEDRRRLALEMHDSLGAMLFAIGASARKLEANAELPLDIRSRLLQIGQQAAEAGDTLRRSLRAMHTPSAALVLDVALRADCRAFEARTSIPARLVDLTGVVALPAARTQALVDAAREALLNVEKHAEARAVVVTVAVRRGYVAVTVVDDGVGFGATAHGATPGRAHRAGQTAAVGAGLGLAAARERLERVGGGLAAGDNDEGGATVRAWVPDVNE